jgi:protein-S-isoprenylcysteine O-methyltransferase Ste14
MTDDQLFQFILIAAVAILFPIAAYHRIRSMSGEKLDRSREGPVFLTARVVLAGPFMIGFLAYLINPEWMEWSSVPLPTWLRWFGVAVGVCCGLLLTWTFVTLGKNITDTVVTCKGARPHERRDSRSRAIGEDQDSSHGPALQLAVMARCRIQARTS